MIAVVVLTFRRPAGALRATVGGVLDAGGADLVVVVDNGLDATAALSDLADSRLRVVVTGANLGYAGGMNEGIRVALAAGARSVAVLNDDLMVEPGWLAPLVDALSTDGGLGAVQPLLVERASEPPVVNSRGVVVGPDGAGTDLGRGEPVSSVPEGALPIDTFTGGAVLFRDAFLRDVGLFDQRFFLYYEDVDLAARGRRRGWRYACVTASRVHHEGSATAAELGDRQRYFQERNRLWTVTSYGAPRQVLAAWWLSVRRLRHQPRAIHARALLGGLGGVPRRVRLRA